MRSYNSSDCNSSDYNRFISTTVFSLPNCHPSAWLGFINISVLMLYIIFVVLLVLNFKAEVMTRSLCCCTGSTKLDIYGPHVIRDLQGETFWLSFKYKYICFFVVLLFWIVETWLKPWLSLAYWHSSVMERYDAVTGSYTKVEELGTWGNESLNHVRSWNFSWTNRNTLMLLHYKNE